MDRLTVLLILGLVGLILVALVGGRIVIGPKGLQFNSQGLLDYLNRAREEKGMTSSGASSSRQGDFIQRTTRISRSLPAATILWVDDKPLNNLFERRAFAALGIFCDSYTTNADALAALRTNGYDLIISDIGRGDSPETGWHLLDEVRYTETQVPFVFYTMGVNASVKAEASARGASSVEQAPDQLIDTVLSLLSSNQ